MAQRTEPTERTDILSKIVVDSEKGVVQFNLSPTDALSYADLPRIVEKVYREIQGSNVDVVKITGRGPIWLYSAVTHAVAHLAKAIAVFDAVNRRYVVVVTHSPEYRIGDVLSE